MIFVILYLITVVASRNITFHSRIFYNYTNSNSTENYELNEQIINGKWSEIQSLLNEATSLNILTLSLTEQHYLKILNHSLPKIESLSFIPLTDKKRKEIIAYTSQKLFLTPKIIEKIFTSQYFGRLKSLNLKDSNLDWRYFNFTDNKKIQSNLQKLMIGKNYLHTKALQLLSKIKFKNKLRALNFQSNSLHNSESVNQFIQIICGHQVGNCSTELGQIDIAETMISRQDFIKLFNVIDTTKLEKIDISSLNLQYNTYLEDGLNFQAFSVLSNLSFPNLKSLKMNKLDLDKDIAEYLSGWKLPQLENLQLSDNFLDKASIEKWITSSNMPLLKNLNLHKNVLRDDAIEQLKNQNFNLSVLNIGQNPITKKGIKLLSNFNTEHLEQLNLEKSHINDQTLRQFLQDAKLSKMKNLVLANISKISNFFEYVNFTKLQNLEILNLQGSNLFKSFQSLINSTGVLLPKLIWLDISKTEKSQSQAESIVNKTLEWFPVLIQSFIGEDPIKALNFSKIQLQKINPGTIFNLHYITFFKISPSSTRFTVKLIQKIHFIALKSSKRDLSRFLQSPQSNINQEYQQMPLKILEKQAMYLQSIFDFSKIYYLEINRYSFNIFKKVLELEKIIELPNLYFFTLSVNKTQVKQLKAFLSTVTIKNAQMINISITQKTQQNITKEIQGLISKNKVLKSFKLNLLDIRQNKTQQKELLDNLKSPFLFFLKIDNNNFNTDSMKELVKNSCISLRQVFLDKNDLSINFTKMLKDNQFIFSVLYLEGIIMKIDQFQNLAYLNTQFLIGLNIGITGANSQYINRFLQIKRQQNSSIFPRLKFLMILESNIDEKAMISLLETNMWNLEVFFLARVNNHRLFNIFFSFPNKISLMILGETNAYSINSNLSPKATRRLQIFLLMEPTFSIGDYQYISELQFYRLGQAYISLDYVKDCEIFGYIYQITKHAGKIFMKFSNDKDRINSTCFTQTVQPNLFESVIIEVSANTVVYSPEFVEGMLMSQNFMKEIILTNLKLNDSTILKIIAILDISDVQILQISKSYLTDQSVSVILQSNFEKIKEINLQKNLNITSKSLSMLANRTFQSLGILSLSDNYCGNQGIEILKTIEAPNLYSLVYRKNGLNGSGLDAILQLPFLLLSILDLSGNDITPMEIQKFIQKLTRQKFPLIMKISFNGIKTHYKISEKIIQLGRQKKIQIAIDHIYYLEQKNGAIL